MSEQDPDPIPQAEAPLVPPEWDAVLRAEMTVEEAQASIRARNGQSEADLASYAELFTPLDAAFDARLVEQLVDTSTRAPVRVLRPSPWRRASAVGAITLAASLALWMAFKPGNSGQPSATGGRLGAPLPGFELEVRGIAEVRGKAPPVPQVHVGAPFSFVMRPKTGVGVPTVVWACLAGEAGRVALPLATTRTGSVVEATATVPADLTAGSSRLVVFVASQLEIAQMCDAKPSATVIETRARLEVVR